MRTMVILKGLPGSGKSTLAAEMVKSEPGRWIRINRDDLRAMAAGPGNNPHGGDKRREALIRASKETLAEKALAAGYDVILDDTHLVPWTVKSLHAFAERRGDVTVVEIGVNLPVAECIARDAKREGFRRVGEKVILSMAASVKLDRGEILPDKTTEYVRTFAKPLAEKPASNLPKAIMCDLDGTLAIIGDRSPYDATDCDLKDRPNPAVVKTVLAMYSQGAKVIFMSGRDSKYRTESMCFIERHCMIGWEGTMHGMGGYALHMRPTGDKRKDSIVKRELYEAHVAGRYDVLFVLDDRNQVVDEWRAMGLTCFQVAPGNF